MKSFVTLLSIAALSAASSAALAHPSLIPHEHPHGVSMLPDLDVLLLGVLVAAFALVVVKKVRGS